MSHMRGLSALSALGLSLLSLVACDGAGAGATESEFCVGMNELESASASVVGLEPDDNEWIRIERAYDKLDEIGIPDSAGDAEREGFELLTRTVTDFEDDEDRSARPARVESLVDSTDLSRDDARRVRAFLEYVESTCTAAPTDASEQDFCEATRGNADDEEFAKALEDEDWDKIRDLVQEQADEVEEVGTPEDIPDDAREGFELQIEQAGDLSSDDVEKAFKDQENPFEAELSDEEKGKVKAYSDYESETCSGSGSSSGGATDVPSVDPSDVPSLDPEDLASLELELEKFTESATAE